MAEPAGHSRETELMRSYDLATVCRWIGNSPAVAAKHYAMSTDLNADFQRAITPTEAQQKAQQSPSAGHGQAMTGKPTDDAKTPENIVNDDDCQSVTFVGKSEKWARQDSNNPIIPAGKQHKPTLGAAKSAADTGDGAFAEAVKAIMSLPLDDADKAEAVRRLMAQAKEAE